MATTDSSTKKLKALSTKRKVVYVLLALPALLVILFIVNLSFIKGQSRVGSAYAAHVTCSCRYIQGNGLDSCKRDKTAGMEIVSISDEPDNKRVTASVPFLAEAVAEYRGDYGCINLNEDEIAALD